MNAWTELSEKKKSKKKKDPNRGFVDWRDLINSFQNFSYLMGEW